MMGIAYFYYQIEHIVWDLNRRRDGVFCKLDVLEHDRMEFCLLELHGKQRVVWTHLHDREDFLSGLVGHIDLIIPNISHPTPTL